jgi:hypothetical protein
MGVIARPPKPIAESLIKSRLADLFFCMSQSKFLFYI